ncbi:TPA: hypothetical protein N0F65_006376, partial [Lagenidium giganteum]
YGYHPFDGSARKGVCKGNHAADQDVAGGRTKMPRSCTARTMRMPVRSVMVLAVEVLLLLLLLCGRDVSAQVGGNPWSPFTTLRQRHLVAFYPLTEDARDYAPSGSIDGFQQHGHDRRLRTQDKGAYDAMDFGASDGIDLPVTVHEAMLPEVTFGAWIRLDWPEQQHGCVISQDGSAAGRSLCLDQGRWLVANQSVPMSMLPSTWMFVAATFSQTDQKAQLYVDGEMSSIPVSIRGVLTRATVLGAHANSAGGFVGEMKSTFFYDVVLKSSELNFLRSRGVERPTLVTGEGGYAFRQARSDVKAALSVDLRGQIETSVEATVGGWVYIEALPTEAFCLCQISLGGAMTKISIWSLVDGQSNAFIRVNMESINPSDDRQWILPDASLPLTTWQRYQLVLTNGSLNVAFDGVQKATISNFGLPATAIDNLRLGACRTRSVGLIGFKGMIDEVSLWSRALTPSKLYKLRGRENGLMGYWTFDRPDGKFLVSSTALGQPSLTMEVLIEDFSVAIDTIPSIYGASQALMADPLAIQNGQRQLVKLKAVSLIPCFKLSYLIVQVPEFGLLYQPTMDTVSNQLEGVVSKGAQLSNLDVVNSPFLVYEATNPLNTQRQSSFTYRALCDSAQSENSVQVVFSVSPSMHQPHYTAKPRIQYVLSMVQAIDVDEQEYNGATPYTIDFSGALSPVAILPAVATSAGTTSSSTTNQTERNDAFEIKGNAKIAELQAVLHDLKVESSMSYPLSPGYSLHLPQLDTVAAYTSTCTFGFLGSLLSTPEIVDVHPQQVPVNMSTSVYVKGRNFYGPFQCAWSGMTTVTATTLSSTLLRCPLPAPSQTGRVELKVVSSWSTDTTNGITAIINVFSQFQVAAVLPQNRVIHVGSTVHIEGTVQFDLQPTHCVVMAIDAADSTSTSILTVDPVADSFQSPGRLSCVIPDLGARAQNVSVYMARDSVIVGCAGDFNLATEPSVYRVNSQYLPMGTLQIDVFGNDFLMTGNLSCLVDGIVQPAIFRSSSWLQCMGGNSVGIPKQTTMIGISANGIDFFYPDAGGLAPTSSRFIDITPQFGPISGGTLLSVKGQGFAALSKYECLLGSVVVLASFISSELITCTTPPTVSVGAQNISLLVDGVSTSNAVTAFTYVTRPRVLYSLPVNAPGSVIPTITLISSTGFDTSLLFCRFDNLNTRYNGIITAVRFAQGIFQCTSSVLLNPGKYMIRVSADGQQFSSDFESTLLYIHSELVVRNVLPASGPASGKTVVTVNGEGFYDSASIACRFGKELTQARYISANQMECVAPAWTADLGTSNSVDVGLVTNGFQWSTTSAKFRYFAEPVVDFLIPSAVAVGSTRNVSLVGSYFSSLGELTCRFGDEVRRGTLQLPTVLTCDAWTAPPTASTVSISVSLNGQDYTDSTAQVVVFDQVHLEDVYPRVIARNSNSTVSLYGTGFYGTGDTVCKIGSQLVKASILSSEQADCSINMGATGVFQVQLSLNGGSDLSAFSPVQLQVIDPPRFSNNFPRVGPAEGGTMMTVLTGTLAGQFDMWCIFGTLGKVKAIIGNNDSIVCTTPAVQLSDSQQTVHLSFQVGDGYIVASDLEFQFVPAPVILSVSPPTLSVNQTLRFSLIGGRFSASQSYDVQLPEIGVRIPALVVSTSVLLCEYAGNAVKSGAARVLLSVNGVDFRESGVNVTLTENASIPAFFFPKTGPSTGNTNVAICSDSIHANREYVCRFQNSNSTLARTAMKHCVLCVTNPSEVGANRLSVVERASSVEVAGNDFEFYPAPKISLVRKRESMLGESLTLLSVTGENFRDDIDFGCLIDKQNAQRAAVINSSAAQCWVLSEHRYVNSSIQVSNNRVDYSNPFPVPMMEIGTIAAVSPPLLFVGLESAITVQLASLPPYDVFCHVNGSLFITKATKITPNNTLTCLVANISVSGPILLSLSADGLNPTSPPYAMKAINKFTITQVLPSAIPINESTVVSVVGSNFVETEAFSCIVEQHVIRAVRISESILRCKLPPLKILQTFLQVSINGYAVSDAQISVELYASPRVWSLHPSEGASTGNQSVLLQGTGFNADVFPFCFFGDHAIFTEKLNNSFLATRTPAILDGSDAVEVKCYWQGRNILPSPIYFKLTSSPQLHRIHPANGFTKSNIAVQMTGTFYSNHPTECHFGNLSTEARVLSPTTVVCTAPPHSPGIVLVWVTQDAGPVEGDFPIQLFGSGPTPNLSLECHFVQRNADPIIVSARYQNSTSSLCWLPSSPSVDSSVLKMQIRMANSGVVLVESSIQLQQTPLIQAVSPSVVTELGLETILVDISETPLNAKLDCEFGVGGKRTPARFVTKSLVACKAPSFPPQTVQVRICFRNLAACSQTSAPLSFILMPGIVNVSHVNGPDPVAEVRGHNFDVRLPITCQVGNVRRSAIFVGSETMRCEIPGSLPGCVQLELFVFGSSVSSSTWRLCDPVPVISYSIDPVFGIVSGSSAVLVSGGFFHSSSTYRCHFGSFTVPAVWLTNSTVQCSSRVASGNGSVDFKLEVDGIKYQQNLTFTYVHSPTITSLEPSAGRELENVNVTVYGSGFDPIATYRCIVDGISVKAEYRSQDSLVCVFPSHRPGSVNVSIQVGNQISAAAPMLFEYLQVPVVRQVVLSESDNVWAVKVVGSGLGNVSCVVGDARIENVSSSESELICQSSTAIVPGTPIRLQLCNDLQHHNVECLSKCGFDGRRRYFHPHMSFGFERMCKSKRVPDVFIGIGDVLRISNIWPECIPFLKQLDM